MLGELPVPGRPANLYDSRARASVLAVGAGGVVWIFFLIYHFSSFSLSNLGDDPI